jgi:hypothetical protein
LAGSTMSTMQAATSTEAFGISRRQNSAM